MPRLLRSPLWTVIGMVAFAIGCGWWQATETLPLFASDLSSNALQIISIGIPWVLCLRAYRACRGQQHPMVGAIRFFLIGFSCTLVGQIIAVITIIVLADHLPVTTWADAFYLASYPFYVIGLSYLSIGQLPPIARTRLLLDTIICTSALLTIGWFFLLGPMFAQSSTPLFDTLIHMVYPLADVILLVQCLALLTINQQSRYFRAINLWMLVGFLFTIASDICYEVVILYKLPMNEMVFLGWTLGLLCFSMGFLLVQQETTQHAEQPPTTNWFVLLFPYLFTPFVFFLLAWLGWDRQNSIVVRGTFLGAIMLILIIVVRQILILISLQRANAMLQSLATTDPLTKLPNHRGIVACIDSELSRANRSQQPCSVLFLDIDHFKAVNDTFGHSAGDTILTEFGEVLRAHVRVGDTVGRWGGEEFLIILPESDLPTAQALAQRLLRAVAEQHISVSGGIQTTCSIGVATYPLHGKQRDELIHQADAAMYGAKSLGRNQVRQCDDPQLATLEKAHGSSSREVVALQGLVDALVMLMGAVDPTLAEHAQQMEVQLRAIIQTLALENAEAEMLVIAGKLHEIGKVTQCHMRAEHAMIMAASAHETRQIMVTVGTKVAEHIPTLRSIAPIIRGQYERWDGAGFPEHLRGSEIPLGARLIAIVNAFVVGQNEAALSAGTRSLADVLTEIQAQAGTAYDPQLVHIVVQQAVDALSAPRMAA